VDFAGLAARWRELEQRADLSFFQSWTWVGCLAAERFDDPVLVEATESGRTVALALFNRVRRWLGPAVLHLGASGSSDRDSPYVEHNGVVAETGRADELTGLCLRAVASRYGLVLPGVGLPVLAAVRRVAGLVRVERSQASPFVDLAGLGAAGKDYLAGRSANTRQQVRRSDRIYERQGPIALERANSVETALTMLDEMAMLHQAAWRSRGQQGCFARPFFRRFHRQLITAAMPRGEAALLKVRCGGSVIGILYNFVYRSRMLAYQSGFAYREQEAQAKPGLTCHHRAIRAAAEQGLEIYDFLAGEDRYKRSLAGETQQQVWAVAGPVWSPHLLLRAGLHGVRSMRSPLAPRTLSRSLRGGSNA
jgi:CelD/BcsL family acetyltransferase involved in cellulose biosynthesis